MSRHHYFWLAAAFFLAGACMGPDDMLTHLDLIMLGLCVGLALTTKENKP